MTATGTDLSEDVRHPDTVLVDTLTAYLNSTFEPRDDDVADLVGQLIARSGRPLLDERWDLEAEVSEDRHGLLTGTLTAGPYTVRVTQPTDGSGDLHVAITSADPTDVTDHPDNGGLAITVDGLTVLEPVPGR